MSALKVVRRILVSRRTSPPTVSMATTAAATSAARPRFNIVATVWSGEKMFERDIRFNFFSLTTPEEIATFQSVLEVLAQFANKDHPIGYNERTNQVKLAVSDIQIKAITVQLEARGINVKWHRLDGR